MLDPCSASCILCPCFIQGHHCLSTNILLLFICINSLSGDRILDYVCWDGFGSSDSSRQRYLCTYIWIAGRVSIISIGMVYDCFCGDYLLSHAHTKLAWFKRTDYWLIILAVRLVNTGMKDYILYRNPDVQLIVASLSGIPSKLFWTISTCITLS